MEKITYIPRGVCSRKIDIEIDDGIIKSVKYTGGCAGNTQGVAALIAGMSVEESFRQKRKREKYGVPGLKDSHIIHAGYPIETYKKPGRKENFSQEDSRVLVIVILSIIAICIAGFTLGVLVPKIKINHKVKMVEKVQKPAVEERAEAF